MISLSCIKCGQEKEPKEFYRKSNIRRSYTLDCKECRSAAVKGYYLVCFRCGCRKQTKTGSEFWEKLREGA